MVCHYPLLGANLEESARANKTNQIPSANRSIERSFFDLKDSEQVSHRGVVDHECRLLLEVASFTPADEAMLDAHLSLFHRREGDSRF